MAHETPIAGNLALAEQWPRYSGTEPEPAPAPYSKFAPNCSTAAARCIRLVARTLSSVDKSWEPGEKLETLKIQVRELYDEFMKWPGSYNQLLLSGSLDYCRSVITQLKKSSGELQDKVLPLISDYYSQCLGISRQYQEERSSVRRLNLQSQSTSASVTTFIEERSSVRRLNLQSLQDKFELLQESCADVQVYPRLVDLDPADIPAE